jgi:hypothetical protein
VLEYIDSEYVFNSEALSFKFNGLKEKSQYYFACSGWNNMPRNPVVMIDDEVWYDEIETKNSPSGSSSGDDDSSDFGVIFSATLLLQVLFSFL